MMDAGIGLGEERALRLAILGDSEVVEDVLRDCDIVRHGERGSNLVPARCGRRRARRPRVGRGVENGVEVHDGRAKKLPERELPDPDHPQEKKKFWRGALTATWLSRRRP